MQVDYAHAATRLWNDNSPEAQWTMVCSPDYCCGRAPPFGLPLSAPSGPGLVRWTSKTLEPRSCPIRYTFNVCTFGEGFCPRADTSLTFTVLIEWHPGQKPNLNRVANAERLVLEAIEDHLNFPLTIASVLYVISSHHTDRSVWPEQLAVAAH